MRRDFPPAPDQSGAPVPAPTADVVPGAGAASRSPRPARWAAATLVLALLGLLLTLGSGAANAHEGTENHHPLTVAISELAPSVLRATGDVTLTGVVSNDSDATWPDVNLHPITSPAPLTTTDEVRQAAASPEAVFGERIIVEGNFDKVGDLAPGESRAFSITIDRAALGIGAAPGVYQIGVHARTSQAGVGRITAGSDRVFLPLVTEPGQRAVSASLVVPLRAPVNRDVAGHVVDLAGWHQLLRRGGRLADLLDVSPPGSQSTLTWLVDPAVLEAVEQIAAGNPSDQLMVVPDDTGEDPTATPTPTDAASATPTPSAVPVPGVSDADRTRVAPALQTAAARWLTRATALLREHQVLALPYGDLDVNGAARASSKLTVRANARSQAILDRLAVPFTPALNSTTGQLRPGVVSHADRATQVLVSRAQLTGSGDSQETDAPVAEEATRAEQQAEQDAAEQRVNASVVRVGGKTVSVYDSFGSAELAQDATAMRQRILAEAAARREQGETSPLVVKLPDDWHPAAPEDLLQGLARGWLTWGPLDAATSAGSLSLAQGALGYRGSNAEVPAHEFALAAAALTGSEQLVRMIDGVSPIAGYTERAVLTPLSTLQGLRTVPGSELAARQQSVTDLLGQVTVKAPESVTLSSTSGQFPATLENHLPVPVLVQLRASTDTNLTLGSPGTLSIPAHGLRTLRMEATSKKLGTHQVALVVTDTEGYPTGGRVDIPVRSASVSVIVWWVIAGGACLLVLMIVRRWRQRGLRRRATPLPDPDAARPVAADPQTPAADEPNPATKEAPQA